MKKILIGYCGLALLLCAVTGCGSLQPYDGVKRSPKSQIDVYEAGQSPSKPYKVIMSFSAEGGIGDEGKRHREFAEQAKKLGADAIVFKPTQAGGFGFGPFGGGSKASFSAVAIAYQ